MSEISKNIVSLIVSKEFHKAKTLIHEAMNNKLGILLEEKLLEYAPTLYEQDEEDDQVAKDTEYSSALGGDRYNEEASRITDEEERLASIVDLDSPVDNITISGSDATHSDSINVSHGRARFSNGPVARAKRIRSGLGQSVPWTQDQKDQITGNSSPDEESPVADRVYDTGVDAANVAKGAWLAQKTGVLGGLGRVLPGFNKLPIAKAIYPAFVAGQAVMTAADIAANADWENDKAKATGDTANQVAHTGMRMAALGNPVTGIPSLIDQIINDGRATDAVTDALIQGPQDWLDNMGFGNDLTDPVALKKYNTSLTSKIWPLTTAAEDAKRLDAERKVARDLRRRGVTQQDIEKQPVTAGTVRNGSGQIMQQ